MINLGNKIRELRKKNGLTQEQLANALSVSPQAVSKWEMCLGYPDIAVLPVIAAYFEVSLDSMFDYDPDEVEERIMDFLYKSRVEAHGFEETEAVLLEGLQKYPGGHILRRELEELYASRALYHGKTEYTEKALVLCKQLIAECKDSFIYCGAMEDMANIYIKSGRYDEGKKVIESMPYRYHLDICDRMRSSSSLLNSADALHETREWKRWAHQELVMVCESEGWRFFDLGDYENALHSYEEAVHLLEYFWRNPIPQEYALLQDPYVSCGLKHVNIAACLYKLGRTEECDAALDKGYRLIRDCWDKPECGDRTFENWGHRYLDDYRKRYAEMGLEEYKKCP